MVYLTIRPANFACKLGNKPVNVAQQLILAIHHEEITFLKQLRVIIEVDEKSEVYLNLSS